MSEETKITGEQTRRQLLGRAAAGTAAIGVAASFPTVAQAADAIPAATQRLKRRSAPRPEMNILVIMVDQMRLPQMWLPPKLRRKAMPNLTRLANRSVEFTSNFTASNACSPARSTLTTGLYSHQTATFITQELKEGSALGAASPDMNPGFPTYGTMLRSLGYDTPWIGKWHLSAKCDYEPYGFANLTCPSPNGGPGEGLKEDRKIASQFIDWIGNRSAADGPWCTTVSLVNPHDIAFYPRFTRITPIERNPPKVFRKLPANFETPAQLLAQRKPLSQRGLQQAESVAVGRMPFHGKKAVEAWTGMLDAYLLMHRMVDQQIGRVMAALNARPKIAKNTVVMFLADHGDYCGAHGQRGKGAMAYDEAIHVPFTVYDPSGTWAKATGKPRPQLTSSVDLAPLLMTMASGGSGWRQNPEWAHLRSRLKVEKLLRNPNADGRPYIVHATDERAVEEGPVALLPANAPTHIVGVRTAQGKLANYSYWPKGTTDIQKKGSQQEAYDYSNRRGRLELDNEKRLARAKQAPVVKRLERIMEEKAIPKELRQPLPPKLAAVQKQAMSDYLKWTSENSS